MNKDNIDIDLGKIYDNIRKKDNKKIEGDYLQVATAFNGTIRMFACKTTNAVLEAQKTHNLYPTATAAVGRTLTAALMMGAMLKEDQSLAIKIEGDGPIGKICCETDSSLRVMAYCGNPGVYLKYNNGHLAVADAVGRNGTLTVTKDLHLKEPYSSSVPLISGELAEDFTYYFTESEQVPSSVSLGVLVGLNANCIAAGGFIVQVMNGCKDETITILEENLKKIPPVSNLIQENKSLREIFELIVGSSDFNVLATRPVKFACTCSKEKYRFGLKSLGYKTLSKLLKEDHGVVATCQYCHKAYTFDEKELEEIISEMKVN